jgi:hypothetical protein
VYAGSAIHQHHDWQIVWLLAQGLPSARVAAVPGYTATGCARAPGATTSMVPRDFGADVIPILELQDCCRQPSERNWSKPWTTPLPMAAAGPAPKWRHGWPTGIPPRFPLARHGSLRPRYSPPACDFLPHPAPGITLPPRLSAPRCAPPHPRQGVTSCVAPAGCGARLAPRDSSLPTGARPRSAPTTDPRYNSCQHGQVSGPSWSTGGRVGG